MPLVFTFPIGFIFPVSSFHLSNSSIVYVDFPVNVVAAFIRLNNLSQKWPLYIVDVASSAAQTIYKLYVYVLKLSIWLAAYSGTYGRLFLRHVTNKSPWNSWILDAVWQRPSTKSIKALNVSSSWQNCTPRLPRFLYFLNSYYRWSSEPFVPRHVKHMN